MAMTNNEKTKNELFEGLLDSRLNDDSISHMRIGNIDVVFINNSDIKVDTLKFSKPENTYVDGNLFTSGCQVANDDIKRTLKSLGFELDKNQMHDVMETIIFHIART